MKEQELELFRLINRHRRSLSLKSFQTLPGLYTHASYHAASMANQNFFAHDNPFSGETFKQRAKRFTPRRLITSENIAAGLFEPGAVLNAWLESKPHRRNLESGLFKSAAVAVAYNPVSRYQYYWVLELSD